jgi:hypothetical protein
VRGEGSASLTPSRRHLAKANGRTIAILPSPRRQSAHWRRRAPLTLFEALIDRIAVGPIEVEGGGVAWRIETVEGFADWLELVYEAGEPLGLSARLFDRPRVTAASVADRLAEPGCVVVKGTLPVGRGGIIALSNDGGIWRVEHRDDRAFITVVFSSPSEAEACAFFYRVLKTRRAEVP